MKELLVAIAAGLVEEPEQVTVTVDEPNEEGITVYHLHVAENDMGKVIGKNGKTASALRSIVHSASAKYNRKHILKIK